MNRADRGWLLARCLGAALLILAAAPAPASDAERLDDVVELARALPTGRAAGERPEELQVRLAATTGGAYRVVVPASAERYDKQAGVFHVRLLTGEERILAAIRVNQRDGYMARTREGAQVLIRRERQTVYELEPVEGIERARDLVIHAPPTAARGLWGGLVAVCEFRVVPGADGLPAQRIVEAHRPSFDEPLDSEVTTYVVRVALDSVTLKRAPAGPLELPAEPLPPAPPRSARAPRGE